MRRALKWTLPVVAVACLAAGRARGDEDPDRDARLAAIDGKFREAEAIIDRAPAEVQNNPDLRLVVGEQALRAAKTATGEEKRQALMTARRQFAKAIELKPTEGKAAAGVVQASSDLADVDRDAKNFDDEKSDAKFALEFGDKALAAGVNAPAFKLALGRLYGRHAGFYKTMKDRDALVAESAKASTLLAEASVGSEQAGKILSEASQIRLRVANLVHEQIPTEAEKADDEALAAAIDLATQACNLKGASDVDYLTHFAALRLAHQWGMKLATKPFMQPAVPPLEGLKLEVPRAPGWARDKPAEDWDLLYNRNLHDAKNDGTVQITLKKHAAGEMALGKGWGFIADMAARQFDKIKGDLKETGSVVEPVNLATSKGAPECWHYEAGGTLSSGRVLRDAEWIFPADKKKDAVWCLKVKDWRPVQDVQEPDIVAFVASAIGDGLWPQGAATPEKPDPKKPPTPPKKK